MWSDCQTDVARLRGELRGYQANRIKEIEEGCSGMEIMDYFARELVERAICTTFTADAVLSGAGKRIRNARVWCFLCCRTYRWT